MEANLFYIFILFSLAIVIVLLIVYLVRYLHESAEWCEKENNNRTVKSYNAITRNNTEVSSKKVMELVKDIIFFNTNHNIVRNLNKISKQLEKLEKVNR